MHKATMVLCNRGSKNGRFPNVLDCSRRHLRFLRAGDMEQLALDPSVVSVHPSCRHFCSSMSHDEKPRSTRRRPHLPSKHTYVLL